MSSFFSIGLGYFITIALAFLILLSTLILSSYFCCRNRNRYPNPDPETIGPECDQFRGRDAEDDAGVPPLLPPLLPRLLAQAQRLLSHLPKFAAFDTALDAAAGSRAALSVRRRSEAMEVTVLIRETGGRWPRFWGFLN
ncbi:RING-H2 finger protein ATL67-like [Senna tora]|uniref:RING-H2 finger protein ATL67-like n=1 Tax=Senna tora TaxID=362788 RepID=A0A834TQH6_9FABA|nr:RING-H2 finger protein ATL67-like [Senna tora]